MGVLFKSKSNPKVRFYLVVFGLFVCYTVNKLPLVSAVTMFIVSVIADFIRPAGDNRPAP